MYPLTVKLTNRKILFIGGGKIADRKIRSLLKISKPEITVIAPIITPNIKELCEKKVINWENTAIDENIIDATLKPFKFVFACTDKRELNRLIGERCRNLDIMVNVADMAEESTFHMPAMDIIDGYTITVSSGGESPAGSKKLRDKIINILKDID